MPDGCLRQLRRQGGPAAVNARILGPRYACVDSFADHRSLTLGKHAHHLKHRLAGCGGSRFRQTKAATFANVEQRC